MIVLVHFMDLTIALHTDYVYAIEPRIHIYSSRDINPMSPVEQQSMSLHGQRLGRIVRIVEGKILSARTISHTQNISESQI